MVALSVVGVPSSAGSYAAGQDRAPAALRAAGLVEALTGAGLDVRDAGDLTEQVWAPDRADRLAQNLGQVTDSVRELAAAVPGLVAGGRRLLVIGGNCLVALGAVAGLGAGCGLLYVDRHFDMNTPESTAEGALDWMGVAHALDLPGCRDLLAGAFDARPVLEPGRLAFLGVDPTAATDFEREQVAGLGIGVTAQVELVADPAAAAAAALRALPDVPLVVHVDVDVLDFVDAPLAENTDGRVGGPTLDQLEAALGVAVADPRWRALTVGELNPTRSAGDPQAVPRFVSALARILACA